MNKKRIDELIPIAYEELKAIAKNNEIDKTYRGGVSSFGAAVSMGSIRSAAAFFSASSSGATYDRKKLGQIILAVATSEKSKTTKKSTTPEKSTTLYEYVMRHDGCEEELMDAAVAVKLAMTLYDLK